MVQHRMGGGPGGGRVCLCHFSALPGRLLPSLKGIYYSSQIHTFLYFAGEERCTDGGTDKRTDIWTNIGEGGSHITCQHIPCEMSVQCNTMKNPSIVYFSTTVGWLTKKYKEVIFFKKSCFRAEILQEALEVHEMQEKKFVIFCWNFDQFMGILGFKKSSKIERK